MMKKYISKTITSILYFFSFSIISLSLLGCSSEESVNTVDQQTSLTEAENILLLVNEARANEGLNLLVLNEALNEAAYKHSLDMNNNDYFNHTGLNGSTFSERAFEAGYTGFPSGENIAKGQNSAVSVHTSWMNSSGHKANILKTNITEMGLGLSGAYWTQLFGTKN